MGSLNYVFKDPAVLPGASHPLNFFFWVHLQFCTHRIRTGTVGACESIRS